MWSELSGAQTPAAPVAGFRDGAKHYRDGAGREDYLRHEDGDAAAIADNILLYQRTNGGWPSNWDPQRVLDEQEVADIAVDRIKTDTTFDNRATYPQIEFLAATFAQTGQVLYRDAAIRGIEFMLGAQHPRGGFPHSYPSRDNYRPYITFMDDVTAGALTMLRKVAADDPVYAFVGDEMRGRIREAVKRGVECVLRLQQPWNGKPAVWAGQYDPNTLDPVAARKFEQPGFVCAESVGVVRFLMDIEQPAPEIIAAIEGACAWFEAATIHGLRIDVVPIDPVRFDNHTATRDVRAVADPAAPPVWARFYEFDTNRPFMANRDGIKVYSLEEVSLERRSGYNWYGTYPARLLAEDLPAWGARVMAR